MEPQTFGKFLILAKIAQGGMAEIFKAQVKMADGTSRIVAIKKILPQFCRDEEFITLLTDEARLMVTLNHPNIVPVMEFGMVESDYYLALEFINGRTLKDLLVKNGEGGFEIPLEVCAYIAREVASGLDYAHRKNDKDGKPLNIIHRDISPTNVLISYSGDVKIVDFGISKAASHSHVTRTGIIRGKMGYMSPEQTKSYLDIDSRSDLYSVGILLWEMVAGRRLYEAGNINEAIKQVRRGQFEKPSAYRANIPKSLEDLILKALEHDVLKRFQSAAQMRDALNEFLAEVALKKNSQSIFSARELAIYVKHIFKAEYEVERETQGKIGSHAGPGFGIFPPKKEITVEKSIVTNADYELSAAEEHLSPAGKKTRLYAYCTAGVALVFLVLLAVHFFTGPKQHGKNGDQGGIDALSEIEMSVLPPDATITVGGVKMPVSDGKLSVKVPQNRLSFISAEAPGFKTKAFLAKPLGALEKMDVVLEKSRSDSSSLLVFSEPDGAAVYLDGRPTGAVTPALVEVSKPQMKKTVQLRLRGFKKKEITVDFSIGKSLFYDIWLEKE